MLKEHKSSKTQLDKENPEKQTKIDFFTTHQDELNDNSVKRKSI
jgi:hypothetical protein